MFAHLCTLWYNQWQKLEEPVHNLPLSLLLAVVISLGF